MINPSRIRIIAIGKIQRPWIKNGLDLYKKRLPNLSIVELRDSDLNKEASEIRSTIKKGELLIALDEEGESFSSITFSNKLQQLASERLVFAIGGADGLSSQIKDIAHLCLSLSPLTFPHEIARLLLVEQLYRASTIALGGPYHRGRSRQRD